MDFPRISCGKNRNDILYWEAFGHKVVEPREEPVCRNTFFDLASMTKPIATATSIMILRDRKAIELDDYVSAYLCFCVQWEGKYTLNLLCVHSPQPSAAV